MDEYKNINKKANLPEENRKNIETAQLINPFFEGNHLNVFLYRKAEKLASALYMVTNLIPEKEILRKLLRDKSINIFSEIMHLQKMSLTQHKMSRTDDSIESRHNSLNSILSCIAEIISYLEILHSSGYISEMNFTILKREYIEFGELIKNRKDDIAGGGMRLEKDFFDVPDLYKTYTLRHSSSKMKSIKDINRQTKDTAKNIKDTRQMQNTQNTKVHLKTAKVRHNSRRNIILELLQNKPFITIKDAENAIKECSAKTLQRELLSLVNEGILKKEGERRWSTYSLV